MKKKTVSDLIRDQQVDLENPNSFYLPSFTGHRCSMDTDLYIRNFQKIVLNEIMSTTFTGAPSSPPEASPKRLH